MSTLDRLALAMLVAASHAVLFGVVQVESALAHLYTGSDALGLAAALAFAQVEAVGVLVALSAVAYAAAPRVTAFRAVVAGTALINLWVVLDQLAYRYFHDHYHLAMNEGRGAGMESVAVVTDSFRALADRWFWLNGSLVVALAGTTLWLARGVRTGCTPGWLRRLSAPASNPVVLVALALLFLGGHALTSGRDLANLDRHPLVALFARVSERPDDVRALDRSIFTPRFGRDPEPPAATAALARARAALHARKRKPNVVLVILESVGASGILGKTGVPSPRVTPFLASQAAHSVIFENVYVPWPGTVRSHASILTGGRTITWGSAYGEFGLGFLGTSLPGALKKAGYRTATIASADDRVHNLYSIYEHLGYDRYTHFGLQPYDFQLRHRVFSWGGDESAMLEVAFDWWDETRKIEPDRPVLLQFNTITTHHPYAVPAGYQGPQAGTSPHDLYLNSIHHTDGVLAELCASLRERGLADDTVVLVTGDHGSGVGGEGVELPSRVGLLNDDMMRSFLMIIDPARLEDGPVRSGRVASNGDILPTILGLVGEATPSDVLGQDLLAPEFEPRNAFFHYGLQLGLRDGRWKFMARDRQLSSWSLHDIDADPTEANDLARRYPERAAIYQDLCLKWYSGVNAELVRYLDGELYPGLKLPEPKDLVQAGPTSISFGVQDALRNFTPRTVFHPADQVAALSFWVGWTQERQIRVDWIDPDRRTYTSERVVGSQSDKVISLRSGHDPFKPGLWTVVLSDGERELVSGRFLVSETARRGSAPGETRAPGLTAVTLGTKDEIDGFAERQTRNFHPHERVCVRGEWFPFPADHSLRFDWFDPNGATRGYDFVIQAGWTASFNYLPERMEPVAGRWMVRISEGGRVLVAFPFRILPAGQAFRAPGPVAEATAVATGPSPVLALREQLGLADAQVDRLQTTLERLDTAESQARVEQDRLRAELARRLDAKAPLEDVRQVMHAVARGQVELSMARLKARRVLESVLTASQLAEWDRRNPAR